MQNVKKLRDFDVRDVHDKLFDDFLDKRTYLRGHVFILEDAFKSIARLYHSDLIFLIFQADCLHEEINLLSKQFSLLFRREQLLVVVAQH